MKDNRFTFELPYKYQVKFLRVGPTRNGPHENRGQTVPVTVHSADGEKTIRINMREAPPLEHGFLSLGQFSFKADEAGELVPLTA
jgi:hypothetical protein